jgi:hypothetical protein
MFERGVLRGIVRPKWDEVTEENSILNMTGCLYSSHDIIIVY